MTRTAQLAVLALLGCDKPAPPPREAYAIGTEIGGGLRVVGETCTYEAPASVAVVSADKTIATGAGEGTVIKICNGVRTEYDVVRATALRIDGPRTTKTTATGLDAWYRVTVLGGTRELRGVSLFATLPEWTLGKDCDQAAMLAPPIMVFATGERAEDGVGLIAVNPGSCTLTAAVLGLTASIHVTIESK